MNMAIFCVCVIFGLAIFSGFAQVRIETINIECVPLNNCSFAIHLLSKWRYNKDLLNFINSTKCGVEEGTKMAKVWCNQFVNCRTPDRRNGTCIHVSSCRELNNVIQTVNLGEDTSNILSDHLCHIPGRTEKLVCCPWTPKTQQTTNPKLNQGHSQKKRSVTDNPWSMPHNHGHPVNGHRNDFNLNFFNIPRNHFHDHTNHNHFGQSFNEDTFKKSLTNMQKSLGDQTNWFNSVLLNNSKSIFNGGHTQNNYLSNSWFGHNGVSDDSRRNSDYDLMEETSFSAKENCLTPENSEGICKEIRQCSTIVNVLQKVNRTDYVEVDYLKKFQCPNSGRSDVKVCCSDQPIVLPSTSSPIASKVDDTKEDNGTLIDFSLCGRQANDNKIIGGTTTNLAEYPWTALLQHSTSRGVQYGCGGSIINKRYILTAAHCVNKEILRQADLLKLDKVILGEYDTRNETDCIYTRYGSECADPPQSFNVEEIIEHESFRFNSTLHDIALIKLDKDIKFSDYVRPICLPDKDSFRLMGNESFFIAGWGRIENGETSPVKRKVKLPFVDKVNCNALGSLGDGQMCLKSGNGSDSCKGDSGGPVMHTVPRSADLVTTLVGIISYGFGRCGTTVSVSTYVPFYLDWILSHLSV